MNLKILTLNCQKDYNKNLKTFLENRLKNKSNNVFLLQEASNEVLKYFKKFKNYKIINNIQKNRKSMVAIVYDCTDFIIDKIEYKPILEDKYEKTGEGQEYQSFGMIFGILKHKGKTIKLGSIHLPSGYSAIQRSLGLKAIKEKISQLKSDITIFGGDCNFCWWGEDKNSCKIVYPEFKRISDKLSHTLNAYFTESELNYSWIKVNNFLKKLKFNLKFKTDQIFACNSTIKNYKYNIKLLEDRVSDHSPIQINVYE